MGDRSLWYKEKLNFMKKNMTYHRNLKIPAILLICLGINATLFAQPMEKLVAQLSSPIKAVAQDLNHISFNVDVTPASDSNKLVVSIENPERKKLHISLRSPSNWQVYNEQINGEEYRKRFDFSKAEDGAYTLIVSEKNKTRLIKQININTVTETVTRKMEVLEIQ
jgi:hypothetical protein